MATPYRNATLQATAALVLGNKLKVIGLQVDNFANTARSYLQLYNAAAAADVTVGTTTPDKTMVIPGSGAMDFNWGQSPLDFSRGLVIAATTTVGGSTDPTAGVLVNIDYERM